MRIPSITAVEAYFSFELASDISKYHFDVRRGMYTIENRNNEAIITQRFYVHRRMRNLIVNEIRVELIDKKEPISVELYNLTRLELNTDYVNSPLNPNRYMYYQLEHNPENMTLEHRVVKHPTLINKRLELNDGI